VHLEVLVNGMRLVSRKYFSMGKMLKF
jgi:hypothetical protein